MGEIKKFMGEYGFFIASICFLLSYILDDTRDSTNLVFAIVFFVFGFSNKRI